MQQKVTKGCYTLNHTKDTGNKNVTAEHTYCHTCNRKATEL